MNFIKKSIPFILIATFVGWFCFKFFIQRDVPRNDPGKIDWTQLDKPVHDQFKNSDTNEPQPLPQSLKKTNLDEKGLGELTDEEADAMLQRIEEIEGLWLSRVSEIFGPKLFDQYIALRDRNEKEKLEAYKAYHDFLKNKYGDRFSYNISEDQSKRESDINQLFLRELTVLVGEEKFKEYLKVRDEMNLELHKKNELFYDIEF